VFQCKIQYHQSSREWHSWKPETQGITSYAYSPKSYILFPNWILLQINERRCDFTCSVSVCFCLDGYLLCASTVLHSTHTGTRNSELIFTIFVACHCNCDYFVRLWLLDSYSNWFRDCLFCYHLLRHLHLKISVSVIHATNFCRDLTFFLPYALLVSKDVICHFLSFLAMYRVSQMQTRCIKRQIWKKMENSTNKETCEHGDITQPEIVEKMNLSRRNWKSSRLM
jgi:hypothetical protein